ncbi:penicillin-binding protein activator LpoB [Rickettsiales bacterium LUAb2]
MKKYLIIIAIFGLALITGCSPKTSYQSIDNTAMSSYFSVQDQYSLVNQLSQKITSDPDIKEALDGQRPTLLVDVVKNKTSEHIDTESITDTLKNTIISAKLFRIIDRSKMDVLAKEQQLNNSGLTDSQRATQIGKLWGAKFVLYGNFSSIVNYVGKEKTTFYKLTLIMKNIETGEEIWVGEASVNKVTR